MLSMPVVEDAPCVADVPKAIPHGDARPCGSGGLWPHAPRRGCLRVVALGVEGEPSIDLDLLYRDPLHEVAEDPIHCLRFRLAWL
jgi:hypothetical protein